VGSPVLRLLGHRRALWAIALLAALLALPSVTVGFFADDFSQLSIIERSVPQVASISRFDLYRFVPADRAALAEFVQRGPLPWFTDPGLKIHFFRPLASAVLVAEHALWGRWAVGYHLTSVLAYAALAFVVGRLYRVAFAAPDDGPGAVTASLAALSFAVASSHAQPVAWIAGRHMLLAAIPAALALAAHIRHARDGWRPGAVLAPLAAAVSLLASESALGGLAFWLAFDAFGPLLSRRARVRAALPALFVLAVYAAAYKALGYGAAHNSAYLDPVADPARFARAALTRVPALLSEAFTAFPSDLSAAFPILPFAVAGLLGTLAMAALARAVHPSIPAEERAALRWLLPGSLLALLLASGGFPGGRLLLFPSFGLCVLTAVLFRRAAGLPGRAVKVGRGWIFVLSFVLGPVSLLLGAFANGDVARKGFEVYRTAELDEGPRPIRAVILVASDPMVAFYPALMGVLLRPLDVYSWQVLSTARHPHRITRTAANRLRVEILGGRLMEGGFDRNFRAAQTAFHVGDRVPLLGAAVTVLALDGGLPSVIEAEFDVPVDDPTLRLLVWREGRLRRVAFPAVGSTVETRWEPGPFGFF
jgi:hypothetical protein